MSNAQNAKLPLGSHQITHRMHICHKRSRMSGFENAQNVNLPQLALIARHWQRTECKFGTITSTLSAVTTHRMQKRRIASCIPHAGALSFRDIRRQPWVPLPRQEPRHLSPRSFSPKRGGLSRPKASFGGMIRRRRKSDERRQAWQVPCP